MKNSINCSNCNKEIAFYELNCPNCNSFVRDRQSNIDLWNIIGNLLESPFKAFNKIIFSEHKNFLFLIIILIPIKMFLNSAIINNALEISKVTFNNFFPNYIISLIVFVVFIAFFIALLSGILTVLKYNFRWKDILSVYLYSLIPYIFLTILLSPIEYALFGAHFFNYEVSPFIIKGNTATILLVIEGILILYSVILSLISSFSLTRKWITAIIIGVLFNLLFFLIQIFMPFVLR